MDGDHADLVSREDAAERILDASSTLLDGQETTTVAPGDGIRGRTLAQEVIAGRDVPADDHATMDGFAFEAPPEYPLEVVDSVYPEDDPPSIEAGEAVRIATGAPLPKRANAVLRSEEAEVENGRLTGTDVDPGTYTYERGSNVSEGDRLFATGERLGAKDAILLDDLSIDAVTVYAKLRVGVLATGSEIHEDPSRDNDSMMLVELLRAWGAEPTFEGTVPDEYDVVRDRIATLASQYDVVVTTGGTSVGPKDYVVRALDDLGSIDFHRVRIRPGKPLALAKLDDAVAFAIPGKPIGAYTVATLVVRPFFAGETDLPTVKATCAVDVDVGTADFEYAIPVELSNGEAVPLGHPTSALNVYDQVFDPSVLSSSTRASRADGAILTDSGITAGETVTVVPSNVLE
ncbi:MAG: molybdopterin molybdotransferase [Halobacteriales archaeon]|jgi:molybdopterin molybdotransferase